MYSVQFLLLVLSEFAVTCAFNPVNMQRQQLDHETQLRAIEMILDDMNFQYVAESVHSFKSTTRQSWERFQNTGGIRERHT